MKSKLANALIVVPILVGTIFLTCLAGLQASGKTISVLFLGFFGLIVVVQVIPALMLFGVLLKEMFHRVRGEDKEPGVSTENN